MTPDELLSIIDRIVEPITHRIESMESKLDKVAQVGERVAIVEQARARTDVRLEALEASDAAQGQKLARAEGRNTVINWILALIGAPLVVAVAAAGIVKLMGIA